jgi:hypothetical protein
LHNFEDISLEHSGMKTNGSILIISSLWFIVHTATAQQVSAIDTVAYAQISFDQPSHAFQDISQGELVEHVFEFTNTGTAPLVFQNVLTTCGCTVPEWPKSPILPGSMGKIRIVFDSSGKIGRQNKVITVRSNSKDGDYQLRISVMVLPRKKQ